MCPANTTACGTPALCVNTTKSAANCGACDHKCDAGQVCDAGTCGCASDKLLCGGACVNPKVDKNNCGACGVICSGSCVNGMCT